MTEAKKQKKKAGHVLRVSDAAWSFIESKKDETGTTRETVDFLLEQLHDLTVRFASLYRSKTYYILPQSKIVCDSEPEARGEAIRLAVKKGKRKPDEEPVAVKVV